MISKDIFGPVELYSVEIEDCAASAPCRREREREAVRRLVRAAFGPQAVLEHRADGSPIVAAAGESQISVSHSRYLAVLAVAPVAVGVDIEEAREQLLRVAGRFMTPDERRHYPTPELILKAWTLKEAAFKTLRPECPSTRMKLPPDECPYHIIYSGPHPVHPETFLSITIVAH